MRLVDKREGDEPLSEIGLLSTVEQIDLIRRKEITSRELTEHFIDRIERLDIEINSVVTRDFETAIEEAALADQKIRSGDHLGRLHGIPVTVKDALKTKGILSTGGATELRSNVPDEDAAVVAAIRREGAIVMGKTNLPRWSGDIQAYNDIFERQKPMGPISWSRRVLRRRCRSRSYGFHIV